MKATSLGLKTGFTRCGPWTDSMWNQFLHTYNLNGEKHSKFCFALGVGYPVKDKPYYWQEDLGNHEHLKPDFPEIDIL